MSIWQRLLDRIAPMMPADLSRLDRLDGVPEREHQFHR